MTQFGTWGWMWKTEWEAVSRSVLGLHECSFSIQKEDWGGSVLGASPPPASESSHVALIVVIWMCDRLHRSYAIESLGHNGFGEVVESFWGGASLVEKGHDRQALKVHTQFWFQPVPSASCPVTVWGGTATQPGHRRACHSASSLLLVEDRNPRKAWLKTNLSFLKLLPQVFCDSDKSYSSHANQNTMFSSIWSLDYCLKM